MTRYLLDTNPLSAHLDRHAPVEHKVDDKLRAGDRVGLCLPVLCEYRAGIRLGSRYQRNLSRLDAARGSLRRWPIDEETAAEFAEVFRELRAVGRVMSQFDLLIAALARQRGLIVLTADQDFRPVKGLKIENRLSPTRALCQSCAAWNIASRLANGISGVRTLAGLTR